MPNLNDLTLNAPGWTLESADEARSVWRHQEGDGLGIFFFGLPPDIGARLDDLNGLRSFCRNNIVSMGGGLVETNLTLVASVPSVRTVIKIPQQPSGMAYVGSLTIPFESFSFVVKAQCEERGATGMRDAVVFDALNIPIDERTGKGIGWMQDPYDPSFTSPVMRNRADDLEWDAQFPDHPLSRCRRHLGDLANAIRLSEHVAASRPFGALPTSTPRKRRWWPFGR